MRYVASVLLVTMLAACGSSEKAKTDAVWTDLRLRGEIAPSSDMPGQVKILLDPDYREENCGGDNVVKGYGAPRNTFVTAVVNERGVFASPPFVLSCKRGMWRKLPPPTFFLSFDNERATFYAVGERYNAVHWRTYGMYDKEQEPRAEACWILTSASYVRSGRRSIELSVKLRENPSSPKPC